jgi:hypothetical protein
LDLLMLEGEDLRSLPLLERKRRLARIMPRVDCRLLYLDHIRERGRDLFGAACANDLRVGVGGARRCREDERQQERLHVHGRALCGRRLPHDDEAISNPALSRGCEPTGMQSEDRGIQATY